ncbi:restriction endonuclease subunit S [Helicobacter pylori]|nr:restriction endonuclease subunit S [Helicobacter pylori]
MDALMLPSNWQRVRLGDIGKPCMCKRVMKHQTTRYGEIPFYKIGTFGNTADAFISKKLFLEYQTKYSFPKKGDILISASGTIGRAIIYDGKPAYFQDSNIVWIDNDETLVKNDFLFYAYSNVKWNTEHTTILRLYNDNFRNTLIPLPSLNEQIAIADILSALDRCLHALDSLIFKKESVKKALSFELLSQRKRLKGFNQAWQKVRLGDIFFITAGGDLSKPHYSNTKQSDFNYPIYSNAIEKKGLYGYSSFFIIKNKSITITSRGTIGVAFFRDYPYVPIGRLLVLQPKISNIDCRFYTEYINSKVKFNTEQTTIPQLTIPKVALCEIPLPPLNEQIAIANILSALNKEIASLKNKKRQFENIKKALNHDLMSAKIRVLKK